MSDIVTITKRDVRDAERAIDALSRIEDRHGDDWHGYDFDLLSSARAALRQWLTENDPEFPA